MSDTERYFAAARKLQTIISFALDRELSRRLKHDRVGIDLSKAEQGALARLLIAKGVFTADEYIKAMADGAEEEVRRQEADVRAKYSLGDNVHFGEAGFP